MNILIAEDDDLTRQNLTDLLEEEGYTIHAACDGEEALRLWHEVSADVVLLDIMMPGKSGYDVCREIRTTDATVPVIFISAKSEEIDIVVGLELGADDFLRKPFGRHELIARIHAHLRKMAPESHAESFVFGTWSIHFTHLLARDGQESMDLTPREVRILRFLHDKAGQDVSREALMNECWGIDFFPSSRTLDQHISNLRKKIGSQWILTVRGVGYKYPQQPNN